jgi:GT2 family glycosyltransferase
MTVNQNADSTAITSPAASGAVETTDMKPVVVRGFVDGVTGIEVIGWAARDAQGPCDVQVIVDDQWVATGKAIDFRADLVEAGIGKGEHGFRIALPTSFIDGKTHRVKVQAGDSGQTLDPGELTFKLAPEVFGVVEKLDGAFVQGWLQDLLRPGTPHDVELLVDGKLSGTGRAEHAGEGGLRFSLRLPVDAMDGRPHHIVVRTLKPQRVIGELAAITRSMQTPDDALRRFSGGYVNSALLQGAALRYESLRRGVAAINAALEDGTLAPEAALARLQQLHSVHEQVVLGFETDGDTALRTRPVLEFPAVETPDVSLVIPVHNKFEVTYHCLASLLLAPNRATFEVILVDDGSSDKTLDVAELVRGIVTIRHETSQGFIHSCNAGGKLARGKYVVMLNNDTEVTPAWLDELVHVFDHFDDVGMAGAKLLYPNGTLQEAGGIVWGSGDPWNYGRNGNPRDPRYNYARQVDYLSGACVMLPTALWHEIGGFDELYVPAYFEDTDLAFRVRDKGYKTVYTPFSQVIHFEGISSGTSVTSGTKRFQQINKPKFKNRWLSAFRGNGPVGKEPDLAKDRHVRFRVLVIDAATPQPDKDAGSYAALQEMRLLQSLGCKLTFVPENLAWLGTYTEVLQRAGIECLYSPFSLSVSEVVERRGSEFDFIYITRYSVAERHIDAIRRHAPQAKVLFNNADLHFLRELRSAIAKKDKEMLGAALRTRDAELAVMRKVDLVLSYNEIEHAVILSHNLDSTRVARCPWVVERPGSVPPFEARSGIAFLGGYGHSPNVEAVEYFVRDVMPLLRERLPGVELRLYGSNMPKEMVERFEDEENVSTPGWVPTVEEVYDGCRVFIAPLLSGAGIKGKVIGALAHGVPCVLSPMAAEGTGLRDGLEALIAGTPKAWVDTIARLYEDPSAWAALQQAAWIYTEREFGFTRGRQLMQQALEAVEIFATPEPACLVHDMRTT